MDSAKLGCADVAGQLESSEARGSGQSTSPRQPEGATYVPGDILASKYRLVAELGKGGMGAIWAARNLDLDADVAIKMIRKDATDSHPADRLVQEARAVAKLGHPNIVRVFDVGSTTDGLPFLVMELLHGNDLQKALALRGKLGPVPAVQLLLPIADALASAHEAGFVHRDLKPENVFLAHQGASATRPILLDFGIAIPRREPSHRLTQEGAIVGSPSFMSPEQTRGEDATHRSDIWAFSVLLYEVVTGKLPFKNATLLGLQKDIVEKSAPTFAQQGLSEDALWEIVARGLAKNPSKRWPSMRTMGGALARWLVGQGIQEDVSNTSIRAAWLEPWGKGAPPVPGARGGTMQDARPQGDSAFMAGSTTTVHKSRARRHWLVGCSILFALASGISAWVLRPGARPRVRPAANQSATVTRAVAQPEVVALPEPPPVNVPSNVVSIPDAAGPADTAHVPDRTPVRTRRSPRRADSVNALSQPQAGPAVPPAGAKASAPSPLDIKTEF
jgi:serine/threonine-protein kinase